MKELRNLGLAPRANNLLLRQGRTGLEDVIKGPLLNLACSPEAETLLRIIRAELSNLWATRPQRFLASVKLYIEDRPARSNSNQASNGHLEASTVRVRFSEEGTGRFEWIFDGSQLRYRPVPITAHYHIIVTPEPSL